MLLLHPTPSPVFTKKRLFGAGIQWLEIWNSKEILDTIKITTLSDPLRPSANRWLLLSPFRVLPHCLFLSDSLHKPFTLFSITVFPLLISKSFSFVSCKVLGILASLLTSTPASSPRNVKVGRHFVSMHCLLQCSSVHNWRLSEIFNCNTFSLVKKKSYNTTVIICLDVRACPTGKFQTKMLNVDIWWSLLILESWKFACVVFGWKIIF